jgi:hypothetical protein
MVQLRTGRHHIAVARYTMKQLEKNMGLLREDIKHLRRDLEYNHEEDET